MLEEAIHILEKERDAAQAENIGQGLAAKELARRLAVAEANVAAAVARRDSCQAAIQQLQSLVALVENPPEIPAAPEGLGI